MLFSCCNTTFLFPYKITQKFSQRAQIRQCVEVVISCTLLCMSLLFCTLNFKCDVLDTWSVSLLSCAG